METLLVPSRDSAVSHLGAAKGSRCPWGWGGVAGGGEPLGRGEVGALRIRTAPWSRQVHMVGRPGPNAVRFSLRVAQRA